MAKRLNTLLVSAAAFMVLGISGCGYKPAPQSACNFVQNSYSQRVSWNHDIPISIYVHESFPVEYMSALTKAMEQWEGRDSLNRKLFNIVGTVRGENLPKRDGVSVIYWMNDWESHKANEQARTTIYWDGSQIREADIRVNDLDFNYSVAGIGEQSMVDLESLLVHELGHMLGLQHNDLPGSVMAVNLASATLRREPKTFDVDSLKCEY